MSLSITFRPQKDLYAVNPPTAYDEPYYNSRWVSGHLPIQYKILNTKWPVNSEDDVDNVCAVSDASGFAQINLCGSYETYVQGEYIKIADSTNTSYNGIWQILDVPVGLNDTYTISAAYDGTATATFQRYYNNYHTLVKVYAGIPEYHQYESEDPMSLIATLKLQPNSDNLSIADISGLVKAKLNCDNDLDQISTPNDLNAWTGFYIEYAESYDVSDGNEVTQFTSDYITDSVGDCNAGQLIINGDFPSNLNGWTNEGSGSTWVYDSNKASATRGANFNSKSLTQLVEILAGLEYNIQTTVINNESYSATIYIILETGTSLFTYIKVQDVGTGTTNINFNIVPQDDYHTIYFAVVFGGSAAQKISLDNIGVTVPSCTYYGFAINGTRQFQNTIGGNFGDYVQNFNSEGILNKFLTHFVNPIWFNSLYFDLSTIIPKSTFSGTIENELYYYIKEYTLGGGFIQQQVLTLESKDDGVYRLPISDLTLNSLTDHFDLQIYQLPQNRLTDGNNGTFEYTSDPGGSPPSDWGITIDQLDTAMQSSLFAQSGSSSLEMNFLSNYSIGEYELWRNTTPITVQQNSEYIIEGYVLLPAGIDPIYGLEIFFETVGISSLVLENYTYNVGDALDTWRYIKTSFNTGASTTVTIKVTANTPLITGGAQAYMDTITVRGPVENLSEIKTIQIDNTCTKQNIYLTWLNTLGAWEYYNFKAEKDYGIDIGEAKSINRDVLVNWDTDFINGETQEDYIGIEANETITVRSQFMTLEQLQAVVRILYAIRVQEIRSDNSKITVLVDKKSVRKYSDGDKLYAIEFDISYPKIEIQTQ